MHKRRSFIGTFFSGILGLILFLAILYFANILAVFIKNHIFQQVVIFLNRNIMLVIAMSIIFLIGELLSILVFPFNLPYPLFNAVGGIFLFTFILRSFALIDQVTKESISQILYMFSSILYPLLFVIILLEGYAKIFMRLSETEELNKETRKGRKEARIKRGRNIKTWQEVRGEFRDATNDMFNMLNRKMAKKKKKTN